MTSEMDMKPMIAIHRQKKNNEVNMTADRYSYSRMASGFILAALMMAGTSAFADTGKITKEVVVGGKVQTQEVEFVSSTEFLPDGKVKQEKTADGLITDYTYTPEGWLKNEKNNRKVSISYTYNRNGKLTKKDTINTASGSFRGVAAHYDYDENQNMVREWSESYFCEYEYDEAGRVIHSKDSKGVEEWFQYDKNGKILSYKDASGKTSTYTYDKKGNLSKISSSDDSWTKYKYNKQGKVSYIQDSQGNCMEYEYNDKGLERYSRESSGKCMWTEYEYDADGNIIKRSTYTWQGIPF